MDMNDLYLHLFILQMMLFKAMCNSQIMWLVKECCTVAFLSDQTYKFYLQGGTWAILRHVSLETIQTNHPKYLSNHQDHISSHATSYYCDTKICKKK